MKNKMLLSLYFVLLIIIIPHSTYGLDVSGLIRQNTRWTLADSPINIVGVVTIPYSEPYTDTNLNGRYDAEEWFDDLNLNGTWDEGEPFHDYDGDNEWDPAEPYDDLNGNHMFDPDINITVTIEPGVTVNNPNYSLDVKGTLNADGVEFTGTDVEQGLPDYNLEICFSEATSSGTLNNCTFTGATVNTNSSSVAITNSTLIFPRYNRHTVRLP